MPTFARRRADEIIQKTHQAVFVIKTIQITIVAYNPAAATNRVSDRTRLVALGVAKP